MEQFNSSNYWENRYAKGGNSGAGSYGKYADYKSETINEIIKDIDAESMIEFGCGDGNQLSTIKCNQITGIDVSSTVIDKCKEVLPQYDFYTTNNIPENLISDLVTSLDVIYHLVEDDVYDAYMKQLTAFNSKYILVYGTNFDKNDYSEHVRARKFTDHSALDDYELIYNKPNPLLKDHDGQGTFGDWFLFKRK